MLKSTVNKMEEGFISLLLILMTLLVFIEVIMRFVFNTGSLWIQELTLHVSAWFVLFGASYGIKVGSHIGVDAVVKLLPHNLRRVASVVAIGGCLLYCGLFLIGSWVYLQKMYVIGIGLEDTPVPHWLVGLMSDDFAWDVLRIDSEDPKIPLWFAHGMLIVGLLMMVYRLGEMLINVILGRSMGFKFSDEAEDSMHLATDAKEGESQA